MNHNHLFSYIGQETPHVNKVDICVTFELLSV